MKPWQAYLGILGLYFGVLLAALPSAPLTDDDDFYIPAGNRYAEWVLDAATFEKGIYSRRKVDAAFEINHEHPPVAKYGLGLSGAVLSRALGPINGPRVGTVLFSTLSAAAILWLAIMGLGRTRGLIAGGLGVWLLLLLPRYFFHSRVATLDVPVAAMYVLTAALIYRAESKAWAAWVVGPVFGLATATKLNAPFIVAPYLLYVLLTRRGSGRRLMPVEGAGGIRLPSFPAALVSMAVLGPLTFWLSWPWLWFDTFERVGAYVQFHLKHYGIYFLYFGRLYDKDPYAPWTMPFVMAAITIPLGISVLALLGGVLGLPKVGWRILKGDAVREAGAEGKAAAREGELILWVGLNALVALATVAFSGGAKYGGAKLFMPFFPFWCLLAGYGGLRMLELAARANRRASVAAVSCLALVGGSALAQQVRYFDVPLSQYNGLVGGLRGATAAGFERQYYDLAFRDLVALLSEKAPANTRVHFLPNNWEYERTFEWYRKEGSLRPDIRVAKSEGHADWVVVTHERRFRRYAGDLRSHASWPVVAEERVDGVPIWTVLSRPR